MPPSYYALSKPAWRRISTAWPLRLPLRKSQSPSCRRNFAHPPLHLRQRDQRHAGDTHLVIPQIARAHQSGKHPRVLDLGHRGHVHRVRQRQFRAVGIHRQGQYRRFRCRLPPQATSVSSSKVSSKNSFFIVIFASPSNNNGSQADGGDPYLPIRNHPVFDPLPDHYNHQCPQLLHLKRRSPPCTLSR